MKGRKALGIGHKEIGIKALRQKGREEPVS
jgi:hypothetical protein